ncbi:MFS transporter [Streptomyces huasconensis]|uniref:MFS transporter n=1 Tax=Streptomyces huasconensis TaxID=1854574 RepID=UPI0036FE6A46
MAGIFAVGSEELVVSPLLAPMAEAFDASVGVMALSVSIDGISTAVAALLFRSPRRPGVAPPEPVDRMAVFILGTVLCAFATGTGMFFTGRALAGLATGAFMPTAYAHVGDQIPYEHRGKAIGVPVSSWSLSLVLGSFIGQWAGWRWTFVVLSFLGAVVLAAMLRVDSGRRAAHAEEPSGQPARGWTRSAARAFLAPKVAVYVLTTFLVMHGWYGLYTFLGTALRDHFGARSSLTGVISCSMAWGLRPASSPADGPTDWARSACSPRRWRDWFLHWRACRWKPNGPRCS